MPLRQRVLPESCTLVVLTHYHHGIAKLRDWIYLSERLIISRYISYRMIYYAHPAYMLFRCGFVHQGQDFFHQHFGKIGSLSPHLVSISLVRKGEADLMLAYSELIPVEPPVSFHSCKVWPAREAVLSLVILGNRERTIRLSVTILPYLPSWGMGGQLHPLQQKQ